MNEKFTLTGGARIGMFNSSFADLYVDKSVLKINASIIGNLVFQPKDIIELRIYKGFLNIGNGVKVVHRIEKYSKEIIFWTSKDAKMVIQDIEKTGFLKNTDTCLTDADLDIVRRQNQGGFPMKKTAAIFFIAVWNLLLLSAIVPSILKSSSEGFQLGIGVNLALGFILVSSILALVSRSFRTLILKEGRDFEDIKKFIYFIIFITGIMFIVFTIGGIY